MDKKKLKFYKKSLSFSRQNLIKTLGLCAVGYLSISGELIANPQNPTVIAGSADFNQLNSSTLQINAQDRTIINWENFSIAPNELTSFIQPGSSASVLNRVTGGDVSALLGMLKSNGSVYLINPNGILIGNGAVIDTASFVASSLDTLDSAYLAGQDLPFLGTTQASVINYGTVRSTAGDIVLLGYHVDNQGTLTADQGAVRLGAGNNILMQINGQERIVIRAQSPASERQGNGIDNSGSIHAVMAELKADGNPYQYGINHKGSIDATGIVARNGQVYLQVDQGHAQVSGSIRAANHNQTGGNIRVLADQIDIQNSAKINASGDFGGGEILIGGDFQGKNPDISNASHVYIQQGAEITADAYINGNGGSIIQWADNGMHHHGHNSARGGSEGGDGGFVETSGRNYMDYKGFADLRANLGEAGTLLLDPTNLIISSSADANVSASTPFYPTPTAGTTANLDVTTLTTALGAGNVIIQTGNDGGVGAGDITWDSTATVPVFTPNNLTLQSANHLIMNGSYSNTGSGNAYFSAAGDITVNTNGTAIDTLSGSTNLTGENIFVQGANGLPTTIGSFTSGPVNLTATAGQIAIAGGNASNATTSIYSAGNIELNAAGNIRLTAGTLDNTSAAIQSTGGNVTLTSLSGSLIMQGGSDPTGPSSSTVNAANTINVNTGLDLLLTAGTGTSSQASIIAGNEVNANVGGSGRLIAQNGANLSSAAIQGANSVKGVFGNDLVLQAGSASNNTATISTTSQNGSTLALGVENDLILNGGSDTLTYAAISAQTGNILISADRDLLMTPGTGFLTFAQIGSVPFTSSDMAQASITVSNVGRNFIMGANPNDCQSYSAIGNGSQMAVLDTPTYSGDIIINGAPSATLSLVGSNSTSGNAFAQIGHFATSNANGATCLSNININGFEAVNLDPNLNYAAIGHGNAAAAPSVINGNITVENINGPISLQPGVATNSFSHIGHFNAMSAVGDVTVNTLGYLTATAGDFQNSKSIIGHSAFGTASTLGNPHFEGKILVSADSIGLNGGINGPLNNAVIGFEPGFSGTSPTSCSIDPSSTITVSAVHDITLQAGNDMTNSDGGNAIIGHLANAAALGPPFGSTINDISVTSTQGSITLFGGSTSQSSLFSGARGQSVIGTAADPNVNFNLPQSNININAAENLRLFGITPNTLALGGGGALITNSAATQPFDININAGNILLSGGNPVGSLITQGAGFATIASGRNLNITSAKDLQVLSNLGRAGIYGFGLSNTFDIGQDLIVRAGASSAQIGLAGFISNPVASSTTFSVGRDLQLVAGSTTNAYAQIGNSSTAAQSDINFTNIGGSVFMEGSSTTGVTNAYAVIGHGNSLGVPSTILTGNISLAGNDTSNLNLQSGGGNPFSSNFTQIGHFGAPSLTSVSGDIQLTGFGGETKLTANSNYAGIGHGNFGNFQADDVSGNINILGTSSSLTLDGGSLNNISGFAQIGHFGWQNLASVQGDINIAGLGGDTSLTASYGSRAVIGHGNLSFATGLSEPANIVGNISITGTPSAGISLDGGITNNGIAQIGHSGDSALSLITGDTNVNDFGTGITLNPNAGYALIGHGRTASSVTTINGNVTLDRHECPIQLNAGGLANTFAQIGHISAQNTTGNVTVNTTGSLELTAGNAQDTKALIGQGGYYSPNSARFSGAIQVSADTIQLNGGTNGLDSNAIIGFEPGNPTSNFSCSINEASSITVTALNDISLQAGNDPSNTDGGNAIIGHAANSSSFPVSLINNITVSSTDGSITLNGGSTSTNPVSNLRGTSLIGTTIRSGFSNAPQSNVIVNVANTLRLFGITPNSLATGGGAALIANTSGTQPFDININAGNILLNGGNPIGGQGAGTAAIASGRNLNINSDADLQMISNLGRTFISGAGTSNTYTVMQDLIMLAGSGSAQIGSPISSGATSSTFDIGRNVQMTAGAGVNGFVQIGDTSPSAQSDLTFTKIGGNLQLRGTSAPALIGHGGGNSAGTINSNLIFRNIGGNVTATGGTGVRSFAQIGHVGQGAANAVTINGDVRLDQVAGSVALTGGSAITASAAIGLGNSATVGAGSTINGQVIVNADNIALTAGSVSNTEAVIGFSLPSSSTGTAINSSLVHVNSENAVNLTAGNDSNAVIGFANPTLAAPNVTIANVVVDAKGGSVALTGGTQGASSGGIASIGTFGPAGGNLQSSIKVTTPYDVILTNSGTGRALITNSNTAATGNTRTVTIDPARIVLLGGSGTSTLFSTGNLSLNVSDALDVNYNGTPTPQGGSAAVLAVGDILINATSPSLAEIRVNGGNSALLSGQITSSAGNVQIGSQESNGAGNVFIGSTAMTGPASISAANDLNLFISGNLTETAGNAATATATLQTASDAIVNAGGDIALNGTVAANATFSSTAGDITANAGGSVRMTQGGRITNGAGSTNITAGFDLSLAQNALVQNAGNGSIQADVGRDLLLSTNANIGNTGNGQMTIAAGRDAIITGTSSMTNTGTGDISLEVQRDINANGSGVMTATTGGNVRADAGRDLSASGTFSFNTAVAGEMELSAGRNLSLSVSARANDLSSGDLTVKAGSDILMSGNTLVRTTSGTATITAGRNAILSNAASIASNSAINALTITAGNDISLGNTASAAMTGASNLYMIADHNITIAQTAAVTAAGGNLTLVVDNKNPDPRSYGTGRIATDAGVTVNAAGGAVRLFTSRQPFNTILSQLNGAPFVAGTQYTNTTQEQWCTYYETAYNGLPFTVFYKDGCASLTCPVR